MRINSEILSVPSGLLSSLVLVLLPKCPFCALAYAGVFSSLGITIDQYEMYITPSIYLILCVSGISLLISGYHRKEYYLLMTFIVGSILLIGGRNYWEIQWMMILGMVIIMLTIISNSIRCRLKKVSHKTLLNFNSYIILNPE